MKTYQCETCGIEFPKRGSVPGRFCSVACKATWQRTRKPVDEAWLRQKYLVEGLSTYDIAAIVDRDPKQVHTWLVGYGIPTRPRGANLAGADNFMRQPGADGSPSAQSHSAAARAILSEKARGPTNYMRRPGVVNPFAGHTHTDEAKAIMREKARGPKPHLRGSRNGMHGRTGASNPNFKDGSAPERQRLYASGSGRSALSAVYERDGFRCVRCGAPKSGPRSLHAHHLKPWAGCPELRFSADNLVTLCRACHGWVHSRANVAEEYLA